LLWQIPGAWGEDAVDSMDDEKKIKIKRTPLEKKREMERDRVEGENVNAAKRHDMT
jgi:hypothetical protein